jgi:hypothetical protein
MIGLNYVTGWFVIDLFSIIPFDIMLGVGNLNKVTRFTRIGRLYKMAKMTKLVRLFKTLKIRD